MHPIGTTTLPTNCTKCIGFDTAFSRSGSTGTCGYEILILWGAVIERGYPSQNWLTFRQALSLGGNVRKGERGTTIVHADLFIPKDEKERAKAEGDEPPCRI